METHIVTDLFGNELHVGDRVAVKTPSTSYKTARIVKMYNNPDSEDYDSFKKDQVQIEYDPIFLYPNKPVYLINRKSEGIKFKRKLIKTTIDAWSIIKLLPEYLDDSPLISEA